MFKWIRLACVTALLSTASSLYAQDVNKPIIANKRQLQESAKQAVEQRKQVLERTQAVVSLLGAEMALNQGDGLTALSTYWANFQNTYRPEVAQRLVNLLMAVHAYPAVDKVYQSWLKHGDVSSPVTQYIAFNNAVAQRNAEEINALIDEVFAQANDTQRSQLFYLLATSDTPQFDLGIADKVYKITKKYNNLSSANILAMYFGSRYDNNREALNALTQLHQNEPQLDALTYRLLHFIVENNPDLWQQFSEKNKQQLSDSWQELHLNYLINQEQYEEANALIKQILDNSSTPSPMLYLQAALLSAKQNSSNHISLGYLEKAYQLANDELQSRIALFSSVQYLENMDYTQAEQWAKKVDSQEHRFEQEMLFTAIESGQKHWKKALEHLQKAKKIEERTHFIFEDSDVKRYELVLQSELQTPEQTLAKLNKEIKALSKKTLNKEQQVQLQQLLQQRGFLYADKLKQHDKAVSDLRQSLELAPDDPYAQNALGYTLLDGDEAQIEEGFLLIEKAYQQYPNYAVTDSLGWAYYKKGEHQKALEYLKRAYSMQPDAEIATHLGEVYWQLGEHEQARKVWREGWTKDPEYSILKETLQRFNVSF
ncbi:MAG: tetratricopeptide repeat protein [Neisseriaceae bacterium]|nr:tetratricopeptide repeat protein [Neisseriaceae bacterium]